MKKILLDVGIDEGQVALAINNIIKLREEQDSLKESNKQLASSGQKNSEQFIRQEAEIKRLSNEIRSNERVVNANTTAQQKSNGSLLQIQANIRKLTAEYNELSREERENSEVGGQLQKQLKALNDEYNEQKLVVGDSTANIGKYSSAFDQLGLSTSPVISGISGMTKASLAFIATPIGAVIGALGLAIAAVTRYFQSSEEGQNKFNKITRVVSVSVGILSDKLSELGEFLVSVFEDPQAALEDLGNKIKSFLIDRAVEAINGFKLLGESISLLFQGEFSKAAEKAGEGLKKVVLNATPLGLVIQGAESAYKSLVKTIEDSESKFRLGFAIEDLKAQTDLLERQLIVRREQLKAEIESLKLRAEDTNLPLIERRQLLQEAIDLQNELSNAELAVAQNRFKIKEAENSLSRSTKEDLNEQAELEARLFQIQAENAAKRKELFTKDLAFERELNKIKSDEVTKRIAGELEATINLENVKIQQVQKSEEAKRQEAIKTAQLQSVLNEQQVEGIKNLTAQTSALLKEGTAAYKLTASTETFINTRAAAIAAYKSAAAVPVIGPVLAPLAGAAAILFGAKQLAAINGVKLAMGGLVEPVEKFARGGLKAFGIGGRPHSQGGTKFYGSDGTRFEAERGEVLAVVNKKSVGILSRLSELNQLGGGVSFFSGSKSKLQDGGFVARAAQRQINQDVDITTALENAVSKVTVITRLSDIDRVNRNREVVNQISELG